MCSNTNPQYDYLISKSMIVAGVLVAGIRHPFQGGPVRVDPGDKITTNVQGELYEDSSICHLQE